MENKSPVSHQNTPFNYAIWLYDMNADDVFHEERHLIVDSSLGLIEEDDTNELPHDVPSHSGH